MASLWPDAFEPFTLLHLVVLLVAVFGWWLLTVFARSVRATYDLGPGQGAAFYEFDEIDDIAAFKAHYRELLDRAPLDEEGARRMTDEVTLAYRLNTAVLAELDADATAARAGA